MLTIRNTGSIADVIASVRDVPARLIPYAAATALTRSAKIGQASVVDAMRGSFDRPTPYTLNATYIEVATKDKLSARIAIKNDAGSGIRAENFLLPEVEGGARREKRFEAALRNMGLMRAGEHAMPGSGVQRDAYGNVSAATISTILRNVGTGPKAKLFAGTVGRKQTRGLWQRSGGKLKPLFIFTTRLPHYSVRLDFTAVAEKSAQASFKDEFYKAATAMINKGQA